MCHVAAVLCAMQKLRRRDIVDVTTTFWQCGLRLGGGTGGSSMPCRGMAAFTESCRAADKGIRAWASLN
jgi:hypothetical protein